MSGARGLDAIRAGLERRPPAWPAADQMTLAAIQELWGAWYHVEHDGGVYRATRPDGVALPEAGSPEGIESAIRADFSRWGSR